MTDKGSGNPLLDSANKLLKTNWDPNDKLLIQKLIVTLKDYSYYIPNLFKNDIILMLEMANRIKNEYDILLLTSNNQQTEIDTLITTQNEIKDLNILLQNEIELSERYDIEIIQLLKEQKVEITDLKQTVVKKNNNFFEKIKTIFNKKNKSN
jgi:hypothetical protein